jgi:hypothetical protein
MGGGARRNKNGLNPIAHARWGLIKTSGFYCLIKPRTQVFIVLKQGMGQQKAIKTGLNCLGLGAGGAVWGPQIGQSLSIATPFPV